MRLHVRRLGLLVPAAALDEGRASVDQRDVDIGALAQPVGRQHTGVPAADHDDLSGVRHLPPRVIRLALESV
jgi:hypothetical protein